MACHRGPATAWLLIPLAAVAAIFSAPASAQITSVTLTASPTSINAGESATATLSVGSSSPNGRGAASIVVELGGDAVLGTDYQITDLNSPTMDSQFSGNTYDIAVSAGTGTATGGAIITAIGSGTTRTLTATVVSCSEDVGDGLIENCSTGASFNLTIVGATTDGTTTQDTTTAVEPLDKLPGLTGNQRIMGATFTNVCDGLVGRTDLTGPERDLAAQCTALLTTTDAGAAVQGVAALTPSQAVAPRKLTNQLTNAQLDNVAGRLAALRGGARGISLGGLTVNVDGERVDAGTLAGLLGDATGVRGGGASADGGADGGYQFERLGIFLNGNIDWGNKDATANEDGFDFDTQGITAGVDYQFLEGLVAGVALGYGNSNVTIDASGGDLSATAWNTTLYGTYYPTDQFYLEGSASYGWGSYDQTRNISYSLLGATRKAKANFDGSQYALMLGAGYDITRGAYIFDVYGRFNYVNADLDGYREQGANGLDLIIRDQTSTSFRSVLGGQVTRSFSLPWAVLLPQGWFEWSHEFEAGDNKVAGTFAYDPSQIAFALATDRFDTDYFRLGVGLGAQFAHGRTAFISYEAALGMSDYMEQSVNLGVRLAF